MRGTRIPPEATVNGCDLIQECTSRTLVCENRRVKAAEFKRRVSRLFQWDPKHGKGSHGTLTLGMKFTTLKDLRKELGIGLLNYMCADLGIAPKDLDNV